MYGKDINFNKDHQILRFVNADCYVKNILNTKRAKSKSDDETIYKKKQRDDNNKDSIVFVQGHNLELDDNQDFNLFNLTILLSSISIVVILILAVIIA